MTFTVNGVNILPYIAFRGIKWSRNDVDSPEAGRNMAGEMERMRVATKIRLDITCRPLTSAEASIVLKAIEPEYFTVVYDDPMAGTVVTKTMYANNNPASFLMIKDDIGYWDGISFPLVEK